MTLAEIFAANVRMLMAANNVSATDLAKQAGVSRNTIDAIKNGHITMVKFSTVEGIAIAFGTTAYKLFKLPEQYLIREEHHAE